MSTTTGAVKSKTKADRVPCIGTTQEGYGCRNKADADWLVCGRCKGSRRRDMTLAAHAEFNQLPLDEWLRLAAHEAHSVRYALLQRPELPVTILRKLAEDSDSEILRQVATHPNTPLDIHKRLSEDERIEVRESIIKADRVPMSMRMKLLESTENRVVANAVYVLGAHMSLAQWRKAAQHPAPQVRETVASHEHAPSQILLKMAKSAEVPIFCRIARRDEMDLSEEAIQRACQSESSSDAVLILKVAAEHESTTPAALSKISTLSADRLVWIKLAGNSATPTDALERLPEAFLDKDESPMLCKILSHKNSTKKLRERILKGTTIRVYSRAMLAGQRDLEEDVYETLVRDPSQKVLKVLAANPALPEHCMYQMTENKYYEVRDELVYNGAITPDVLRTLSQDDAYTVRYRVAGHPKTELDVLLGMLGTSYEMRHQIIKNQNVDADTLHNLSAHEDDKVRKIVADDERAHHHTLTVLAFDSDYEVRRTASERLKQLPQSE